MTSKRINEDLSDHDNHQKKAREPISTYPAGSSIFDIIENGNVESLKAALRLDPNRVRSHNDMGFTALHIAANLGKIDMCQVLIDEGADVDARAHNNSTPLISMSRSESSKIRLDDQKTIIRMLRDKGANFSLSMPEDESPIKTALASTNLDIAEFLLGLVDEGMLYHRDDNGETCAHMAARENFTSFLRKVGQVEPKLLLLQASEGSPLQLAVKEGAHNSAKEILNIILDKFGPTELETQLLKKSNYKKSEPSTTQLAVIKQDLELVNLFLKHGGKMDQPIKSPYGDNKFYCYEPCLQEDNLELWKVVLENVNFEQQKDSEKNPWLLCLEYGSKDCLLELDRAYKRPDEGFESVDWNHHIYIASWAWARRRFYSDLPLQGVTLLQKYLREYIPRVTSANDPEYPLLETVLQGEKQESIGELLSEEFLFARPFLASRSVRQSFAKRLEKWPFEDKTSFQRFDIPLFDHLALADHYFHGTACDLLALGLQLKLEKCPCGECESENEPTPQPNLCLALNAYPYSLSLPMCPKMKKFLEALNAVDEAPPVAKLEEYARKAIRKQKKVFELLDDKWIDELPIPEKLKQFLIYKVD